MQTYTARLKSREQMDREIPLEQQGWWHDCCHGKTLSNLRDATAADLARCIVNEVGSRNPADYLCENIEYGWLVRRDAVAVLTPNT